LARAGVSVLARVIAAEAEEAAMTPWLPASTKTAKTQLRGLIVSAYQRVQHIIAMAGASPATNTHAAIAAHHKARDHLRADIIRASNLFPDTHALLSWLLDDLPVGVSLDQDRTAFALTVRTIKQEAEEHRQVS
jgi:hypothetical protein